MRRAATIGIAVCILAIMLAACVGRQTIELDGCTFILPRGEIVRASDDMSYYVFADSGNEYASIFWNYVDNSDSVNKDVDYWTDGGNIKNYEIGKYATVTKTNINEGFIGSYDTLRYHEVSEYLDSDTVLISENYNVQVHDYACVSFSFTASSEDMFEKYLPEAEEAFDSIKLT